MHCSQCGNKVKDGSAFCDVCGAALGKSKPDVSIGSKPRKPEQYQPNSESKSKLTKRFFAILFLAIISGVITLFVIHLYDKEKIKVYNQTQNQDTVVSLTQESDPAGGIAVSDNSIIQRQDAPKHKISGAVVSIVNNGRALRIGEYDVELYGYEPSTSAKLHEKFMSWIKSLNTAVDCIPKKQKFICYTKDNIDIAQAAILNGVGMASLGAPNSYLQSEKTAQSKQKGIWE